jgi:hypothetical protein
MCAINRLFLQKFLLSTVSYVTLLNNVINFCFLCGEHNLFDESGPPNIFMPLILVVSLNKIFLHNIYFRNVDL